MKKLVEFKNGDGFFVNESGQVFFLDKYSIEAASTKQNDYVRMKPLHDLNDVGEEMKKFIESLTQGYKSDFENIIQRLDKIDNNNSFANDLAEDVKNVLERLKKLEQLKNG